MNIRKLSFAEEENVSVAERKKHLRAYAKAKRAGVVNRDVKETLLNEQFDEAYLRLFQEDIGAGTRRTVFVYISFSSEAPTHRLIERLLDLGHTVVVPRVEQGEMVAVRLPKDPTQFVRSDFGILEPIGERYEKEIHLAVVPFLAVDKQGNRLGYGGGYDDTFLQKRPHSKRMAFGFACQILQSVPTDEGDVTMQCIVTEEQTIVIS